MTCDSHVASENEDTIMSAARYFDKGGKYRCIVGQNIVSPYWLTGLSTHQFCRVAQNTQFNANGFERKATKYNGFSFNIIVVVENTITV